MDAIDLSLFSSRVNAVCDEMGAVLKRTALSPNIRDRLDFSCAVFDTRGELCAQAAHIPVHLGSMAFATRNIVSRFNWHPGDMVILNNPFLGGTHLPDITLLMPVFLEEKLAAFVVNRAHHADIGSESPGSMPVSSRLEEEGVLIDPQKILDRGKTINDVMAGIVSKVRSPETFMGDLAAQISANRAGAKRLALLGYTGNELTDRLVALNDYAERLAHAALRHIPDGCYEYPDFLDDDGYGKHDLAICVTLRVNDGNVCVDFNGTANQTEGNINCPLAVTAAAVYYVFRCLMPEDTPPAAGSFRNIQLRAPQTCLVNAQYPAAIAAGNVETSSRIVDAVLGALAKALPTIIPAASQGTMNNVAMGGRTADGLWDYYETIGGGTGAHAAGTGLSGVQSHMTNTLNTPVERVEMSYPLRILRYQLRRESGGDGMHKGGAGLLREYEFLADTSVTLLTERRRRSPWGLAGGKPASCGENRLNETMLPGKTAVKVRRGDRLTIKTPGGGGWGNSQK